MVLSEWLDLAAGACDPEAEEVWVAANVDMNAIIPAEEPGLFSYNPASREDLRGITRSAIRAAYSVWLEDMS